MADQTIAHYRIGAKLGEGGMGEVYQATDTKLRREVALKFLPDTLTQDPETLERFRREARALATLSHPNIGAIHGIEEGDGRVALVLELIEGDTLADRIAEGTLSRDEALRAAEQIAAALEAAHEQGIVHRDLKPANIKITPEGQVKVLDFGLAKSIQREAAVGNVAESPTIMMTAGQPGMVMGTAPYMSPEQAKGAPVDRRADMWAYGAVLFEMFTGKRLFEGDDVTEVLAAVITIEPDLSRLPADLPAWLSDLIARCLRRDLTMRLPHMAAARIALQEAHESVDEAVAVAAQTTTGRGWASAMVAIVLAVALGAYGNRLLAPRQADSSAAVAQYTELILDPAPLPDAYPAISPDGQLIAYSGASETQRQMLFIRNLADGSTRPLPGSEYGEMPAFSPDGGSVAFIAAGILRVSTLGGGVPESIATIAGGPEGIVWADEDTLIFATQGRRYLQSIASTGGTVAPVEIQYEGADELWVTDPALLPDSETLLVTIEGPDTDGRRVAALSLRDGTLTEVTRGSSARFVAPATLVFLQRGGLVAARFDPSTLALAGTARALSSVGTVVITDGRSIGKAVSAITSAGVALFPMELPDVRELVWVARDGTETPTGFSLGDGGAENLSFAGSAGVSLSPDGAQVALVAGAPLIVDLDDVTRRRVLPRPGSSVSYPRWDPSGEYITVIGNASGIFQGYRIAARVSEQPERFTVTPGSIPTSFFPDGSSAIGYVVAAETARDLWVFHLDGQAELLLQTPANERAPMLSPDGKAFAYVSNETGEDRIYLRLYPDVGQAWELSGDGASEPLWSRDGSEIFFIENARMMAVSVDIADGVRHGASRELFSMGRYESDPFGNTMYDVAADGRFIMLRLGKGTREWRLIKNWGTDLDAIVAGGE